MLQAGRSARRSAPPGQRSQPAAGWRQRLPLDPRPPARRAARCRRARCHVPASKRRGLDAALGDARSELLSRLPGAARTAAGPGWGGPALLPLPAPLVNPSAGNYALCNSAPCRSGRHCNFTGLLFPVALKREPSSSPCRRSSFPASLPPPLLSPPAPAASLSALLRHPRPSAAAPRPGAQ